MKCGDGERRIGAESCFVRVGMVEEHLRRIGVRPLIPGAGEICSEIVESRADTALMDPLKFYQTGIPPRPDGTRRP
jgi:hypothetical protein